MRKFSMTHWLAIGLVPGSYFEQVKHKTCRAGWKVYKAYDKKRNPLHYYFVPDRFNFILVSSKKHPERLILRPALILKLRKNHPIKSTYKRLRAKLLQP